MSGKRRVGVQEFKGKVMVNVREYYEKDGQMLPGKKVRVYSFFYCFSSGMGMKRLPYATLIACDLFRHFRREC